ncbi:MAG: MFS transporter [Gemmatimonadetes bacterium]|nr:MFS transporter [Gemmatimonadota bacterium]
MLNGLRASLLAASSGRLFHGWIVVAVSSLVIFATGPGQSHLIGLFFEPISAELGLSRTALALAYGLATLCAALMLPSLGRLVDRRGPVPVLGVLAALLGLACLAFSQATGWIALALGFAALRFLGQGGLTLASANLVVRWFHRRRGLALGLMTLGFPLSVALHAPLAQALIEAVGWRQSWLWLGLATWILLLPPIVLLLHDRPEDVGLHADGDAEATDDGAATLEGVSLAEALRTPAFYVIAVTLCSHSLLLTALHLENTGILSAHGLDRQWAANMFAVTGLVAVAGMPIVGWLLDRVATKTMLLTAPVIMAAALVAPTFVSGFGGAVGYAVVFGLANAVSMPFMGYMWPRFFGRRHLGAIQGTGTMVVVIGASLGPLPLGLALDYWGGYDLVLRLLAGFSLTCAVAIPFIKPPRY